VYETLTQIVSQQGIKVRDNGFLCLWLMLSCAMPLFGLQRIFMAILQHHFSCNLPNLSSTCNLVFFFNVEVKEARNQSQICNKKSINKVM